jgi:hypothetical protein
MNGQQQHTAAMKHCLGQLQCMLYAQQQTKIIKKKIMEEYYNG